MVHEYNTRANAKINIFLKVCGKYPNGYHRLYMLMQEIDLGDDIKVTIDDDRAFGINVVSDRIDFDMKKDLCYRAAEKFYDEYKAGPKGFTEITAVKNTPAQAGLGGGSSDAASVLKILNDHYGRPVSTERMGELAVSLGADVPFFLYGGSAICEGIGEIVTPLPPLAGLYAVLVKPEEGVSTAACFKACDATTEVFDEDKYKAEMERIFGDETLTPAERIRAAKPYLTNDLEAPALDEVAVIGDLIEAIRETDCLYAAMSGSGSTAFGVYADANKAEMARSLLNGDPRTCGCRLYMALTR